MSDSEAALYWEKEEAKGLVAACIVIGLLWTFNYYVYAQVSYVERVIHWQSVNTFFVGRSGIPISEFDRLIPLAKPILIGVTPVWSVLCGVLVSRRLTQATALRAYWQQTQADRLPSCQSCGYDLRGCAAGTSNCPECGAPILTQPLDRSSE